ENLPYTAPLATAQDGSPTGPAPKRRKSAAGRFIRILLFGGALGGAIYAYTTSERVRQNVDRTVSYVRQQVPEASDAAPLSSPGDIMPGSPWDGPVKVGSNEAKTIGLQVVTVQPQVHPIKLELPGRTDYDPNTLAKIRPRFDTLVEKVRAELGQKVK